jgi:hypothetical protein
LGLDMAEMWKIAELHARVGNNGDATWRFRALYKRADGLVGGLR